MRDMPQLLWFMPYLLDVGYLLKGWKNARLQAIGSLRMILALYLPNAYHHPYPPTLWEKPRRPLLTG
jgi:hypothetical protein